MFCKISYSFFVRVKKLFLFLSTMFSIRMGLHGTFLISKLHVDEGGWPVLHLPSPGPKLKKAIGF